ncbi:hypothetical protein F8388_016320 [Cannabis sativa]|uniref:Uncharacterized protein n=1 Tax=Cannabis sativa TaxID=3483 RepID=A0A7J6GJ08_CANSA|nr:hypothetical protein F8388_016320 [Cannabis sativa]
MASPMAYSGVEDKDLDDAALWAVIDSAVAASASSKSRKPLAIKYPSLNPNFRSNASPPLMLSKTTANPYCTKPASKSKFCTEGEVLEEEPWVFCPPRKIQRTCSSEVSETSPLAVVRNVQRTPTTTAYSTPEKYLSPEIGRFTSSDCSPGSSGRSQDRECSGQHSLSGMFPSVSLFKEYQNAAMARFKTYEGEYKCGNLSCLCQVGTRVKRLESCCGNDRARDLHPWLPHKNLIQTPLQQTRVLLSQSHSHPPFLESTSFTTDFPSIPTSIVAYSLASFSQTPGFFLSSNLAPLTLKLDRTNYSFRKSQVLLAL